MTSPRNSFAVPWAAAVLCGGASRRMGRDKALLVVEGAPMARRVVVAARDAGASPVVTVGGDESGLRAALAGLDVAVVADGHPGEGPLGGLLTALDLPGPEAVLVLSCDLLAPDAGTMVVTVAALAKDDRADVAVPEVDGRAQWLHAAWRRARPELQRRLGERFAAGERSVHRAVAQAGLAVVRLPHVDPAGLADADVPGDLPGST